MALRWFFLFSLLFFRSLFFLFFYLSPFFLCFLSFSFLFIPICLCFLSFSSYHFLFPLFSSLSLSSLSQTMLSLFFILPSLLSLYFFPASLSSLPPGIYKGKTEKRGLLPLSSHGTRVGWSNSPQAAARKACPRVRVWASGGGGEKERVALQGRETSSSLASTCQGKKEDPQCLSQVPVRRRWQFSLFICLIWESPPNI